MAKKRKTIVVDFDGTLCVEKWPEIGKPKRIVLWCVRRLIARHHTVVLSTAREHEYLRRAITWLEKQGVWIHYVNRNTPSRIVEFGGDPRKVCGDYYLDDRACTFVTLRALWLWLWVR